MVLALCSKKEKGRKEREETEKGKKRKNGNCASPKAPFCPRDSGEVEQIPS